MQNCLNDAATLVSLWFDTKIAKVRSKTHGIAQTDDILLVQFKNSNGAHVSNLSD